MEKHTEFLQEALDTRTAAALIGCAPFTLKLSRTTGTLLGSPAPVFRKMGRMVRYDQEVIETWVAQFEPQPHTAA